MALSLTGQLWYLTQGGNQSDDRLVYINNDNGSSTVLVDDSPTPDLGTGFPEDVALDTAANLYFVISDAGPLGGGSKLLVGHINSAAAPVSAGFAFGANDLASAIQIDPYTNHLYVAVNTGTSSTTGIRDFIYNPATGQLTDNGFITKQANLASFLDPRDFALNHDTGTLFFVNQDDPPTNTNEIYRVTLGSPILTPLLLQGQFPTNFSNGYIRDVETDPSTRLVYFDTESQRPFGSSSGYDAALNKIYYISDSAVSGTATELTLNGLPAGSHFYPGDMTFDASTRQLYVESEEGGTGTATDANSADDVIYVFQLDASGHSATLINSIHPSPAFTATVNIGGLTFDSLPTLGALPATSTHALKQGPAITLLTAQPTLADVDGNHLASATVKITGGTFTTGETSAADDHLSVLASALNGTSITASYNSASETLTLTGYDTVAHYQQALAGVQYNTTGNAPTNGGANPTRTLTWQVNDGAAGNPAGTTNVQTTTLTIDVLNQAPVLSGAANLSFTEINTGLSGSHALTVTDSDSTTETFSTVSVTASGSTSGAPANATLLSYMTESPNPVTVSSGSPSNTTTYTFNSGSEAFNYLQAGQNLTLSYVIRVTDNDLSGGGAKTADQTVTVTIQGTNDAPTTSNTSATINEDTAYTLTAADFPFNDVDGGSLTNVVITSLPTAGTLTLGGTAVTLNQVIPIGQVTAGNLVLTPAANGNGAGYASFGFAVRDGNGMANGGADTSGGATFTLNVTAVNDAPTTSSTSATVNEDTPYTLKAADFPFSDIDGGSLTNVVITSLPTAGTLTLSGTAVALNQVIPIGRITAGDLVLTPAANANGANYSSFGFAVQDGDGTANGGADTSGAATFTLNVTAIDDPPSVGAPQATMLAGATITRTGGTAGTGALAGASDPEGDAFSIVAVAGIPANVGQPVAGIYGHLTLNADGSYSYAADIGLGIVTAPDGSPIADSFSFTVSDGTAATVATLVETVTLAPGATETITNPTGIGSTTYTIGASTLTINETVATTVAGTIQDGTSGYTGGSVLLQGSAPLTLTGTSTFTGTYKIDGALVLAGSGAIGAVNKVSLRGPNSSLDISGITTGAPVDVGKFGGAAGSTVELGSQTLWVHQIAGPLGSSTGTFAGVIEDGPNGTGGNFTVDGPGALVLSGINTYTGITRIDGTVRLSGSGSIETSSQVDVHDSGAKFDISGATTGAPVNIGTLSGVAGSFVDLGAQTLDVHVLGAPGTTSTFAGVIEDGPNGTGGNLTVDGPGALVLTGANTYTGVTRIDGSLYLMGQGSIANSNKVSLHDPGAVFDISGVSSTDPVSIGKLGGAAGTTIEIGSHTLLVHEIAGPLGFSSGAFAGTIDDNGLGGTLALTGPGPLTLSHENTYSGGTLLEGGYLALTAHGAAGTGAITFLTGSTLRLDAASLSGSGAHLTFDNTIAGFTASDRVIDLSSLSYTGTTTASFAGSTLTVSNGSQDVSLTLSGVASGTLFNVASDGHGGTLVYDPPEAGLGGSPVAPLAAAPTLGLLGVQDHFDFAPGLGHAVVAGYDPGLDTFNVHGLGNFANLLSHAQDDGHGNVAITLDAADSMLVLGVSRDTLAHHQGDFLFA